MNSKFKSYLKDKVFSQKRRRLLKKWNLSSAVEHYTSEFKASGIIADVYSKQEIFDASTKGLSVRGKAASFGGLGEYESALLYALVRHFKPQKIVETGVCNGVSSYVILKALEENGTGMLYSIDMPDKGLDDQLFWEGKGGAVIPSDSLPGWIIPESLKANWHLRLGNSFDVLPNMIAEVGTVDMFIHDSEHSYRCMSFEYSTVWPVLSKGGLLLSDDVGWNSAFADFSKQVDGNSGFLSTHLGIIQKA